ncbi:RNA polymerase sigma factor [Luteibacter aegosomatissinici]|uniref:RNA polymerase sigma factor n=1 Tax=Luteibacter aegosomatissinici TaxID=2911539 RepID=UPI001FF87DBF|nr:RNA polymerase sigma factor [Luteibacter aegosomatissinici]UPG94300.1 RNA polymerase sigma factor [Luteibacter aegosomatissinici]
MTDGADSWVVAAVAGDTAAFAVGVRAHSAAIKQMARGMGVPETDVDDIVQDTLVAAWRALADFDRSRAFRPWLLRIGVNKVRDLQRFRRVRHFLFGAAPIDQLEPHALPDEAADPARASHAVRELQRVTHVLGQLAPDLREAIVLIGIVGLSQVEAAATLGVSLKTIEGRVLRARAKLGPYVAG